MLAGAGVAIGRPFANNPKVAHAVSSQWSDLIFLLTGLVFLIHQAVTKDLTSSFGRRMLVPEVNA